MAQGAARVAFEVAGILWRIREEAREACWRVVAVASVAMGVCPVAVAVAVA